MNKEEIRKEYLKLRNQIIGKRIKSKRIINKVLNTDIYNNSQVVGVYVSTNEEVDTKELINHSLSVGKIVCVPVIKGREMIFYKIDSIEDISVKNKYNIFEPKQDSCILVDGNLIDLFIIPLVSFDNRRNRIGYGGGYYDRYLSNLLGIKMGIAYSLQRTDKIETESTDIKLDAIITEDDIFTNMKIYATIDDIKRAMKKKSKI